MIFSPYLSDKLMIYDVSLDEITLFKIPLKKEYMSNKKSNFFQMLIKNDELYLMPAGYRAILCFNLMSYEFTEFLILNDYISDNEHISFSYCTPVDDKYFAVASFVSNIVLMVEYTTGNYRVKRLGKENYRFANIINYKNELWLTVTRHAVIIRWDYKQDVEEIIEGFPKEYEMYNGNIFNDGTALIYNNNLYCIPAKSNMGIVVDVVQKRLRKIVY